MAEVDGDTAGSATAAADGGDFLPQQRRRRAWSSDLSVPEAAAVRRIGLVPAGFVMGTAVMQLATAGGQVYGAWPTFGPGSFGPSVGYSEAYPCAHGYAFGANVQEHYGFSVEDALLAASLAEGYRLAISRLHDEAVEVGAHGVVGVDLAFENLVGSPGTATFFARGTAVVRQGVPPLPVPFTTNATGQHLERLVALGHVPVGLAVGVGAVFVQPNCLARGNLTVVGANRQIPMAISVARGRARGALAVTAHAQGDGVVNTEWTDRRVNRYAESWDQLALAVGTAVRRYRSDTEPVPARPVVALRP